ncbi:MAG: hypothetical protein JNG86_17100, partial [Verrucomicrobiaceae bacterium]|nr:hypothetical protein [Verrucomicrobiaceae bacterium]
MTGSSRIVILIASAVCYALAFPPLGLVPLALAGVGGLIWSLAEVTPRGAFARGLLWGLLVFGTGLSWLWNIFHAFCVPLWLLLALFPALFAWLVARARMRGLHGLSLAVYTALAWCGTEFIRCELMPLRFPWMNLGLALEPWPLVSLIGVYGLGLVAMLAVAG